MAQASKVGHVCAAPLLNQKHACPFCPDGWPSLSGTGHQLTDDQHKANDNPHMFARRKNKTRTSPTQKVNERQRKLVFIRQEAGQGWLSVGVTLAAQGVKNYRKKIGVPSHALDGWWFCRNRPVPRGKIVVHSVPWHRADDGTVCVS